MGFHIIPNNLNLDFVGIRKISYILSILVLVAGLVSLVAKGGPSYGIDFAGGTIVQGKFSQPVDDEAVKKGLAATKLENLVVQKSGTDNTDYILRISTGDDITTSSVRQQLTEALANAFPNNAFDVQRLEMVGPKVGADLRTKAVEAIFFAMILIAVYVSGRFEQRWVDAILMAAALGLTMLVMDFFNLDKLLMVGVCGVLSVVLCWRFKLVFALGAIVSILHDVFITIGLLSILNIEFDLTIIAALLTIVGYSLNDTIIVYDRIRENLRTNRKGSLASIINRSINQTLSRTVLTSGTTLLVIASLLIFGADIIHDFSLVMFLGVLIGTYSSMFVASPILLLFGDNVIARAEKDAAQRELNARKNRQSAQV